MPEDRSPEPADADVASEPVVFESVSKRFGPVAALSSVSLTLPPEGMICLAGPNGSGKTTALRLIAGLTRPSTGTVRTPDTPLGISFQQPAVYPSLTVEENLSVFGDLVGADPDWRQTLVDRLRLAPAIHRRTSALSDGFRKKLDLALALLKRPPVCLLDEPLADLDDRTREATVALLAEYATPGRIVVISSHRIERFDDHAKRLVVLSDGTVALDSTTTALEGPPSRVYRSVRGPRPRNGGNA